MLRISLKISRRYTPASIIHVIVFGPVLTSYQIATTEALCRHLHGEKNRRKHPCPLLAAVPKQQQSIVLKTACVCLCVSESSCWALTCFASCSLWPSLRGRHFSRWDLWTWWTFPLGSPVREGRFIFFSPPKMKTFSSVAKDKSRLKMNCVDFVAFGQNQLLRSRWIVRLAFASGTSELKCTAPRAHMS